MLLRFGDSLPMPPCCLVDSSLEHVKAITRNDDDNDGDDDDD